MFRRNIDGRLLQFLLADNAPAKRLALRRAVIPSRVARPGETAVRLYNPYTIRSTPGNKYLDYAWYLCHRSAIKLAGIAVFFVHALKLWFVVCLLPSERYKTEPHDRNSGAVIADEPN